MLFDLGDMSAVRQYVRQQLTKVLSGRLSPAELSFAKEYRGISGYHPSAPVPALKIARFIPIFIFRDVIFFYISNIHIY